MRISAVLPAYDVAPYVGAALEGLLAQDWPDLELIAVDDGSTDGTGEVIAAALPRLRARGWTATLTTQPNRGLGAARNAGLDRATGAAILFLDGDDRLSPGALTRLVDALGGTGSPAMAFPRCRYVDPGGVADGILSPAVAGPLTAADLLRRNPIHTDTGVLVARAAIDRAGRFDTRLSSGVGLDYWMRVAGRGPGAIHQVDAVLVDYRRRPAQITADWRRQRAGWLRIADGARAAGLIDARTLRVARAHASVTWATTAYRAGDHAAARRLMRDALRAAPLATVRDGDARMRLMATAASRLPEPVFHRLSRWVNARGSPNS